MKKNLILLTTTLLTAGALSACGSSGTYDKYVKLGDYKNIEITRIKPEVTEEALQDEISYVLEENAGQKEITDRACENGDMINIDFTGTIDGEEFDGGSDEDYDLELGAGYFLEDLEAGIEGMKTGDTKDITITFPEDYDEEHGGKEAVFSVTLNSIYEEVLPEYNDEFVSGISDFSTVEEYEEDLKNTLLEDAQANSDDAAYSDVLTAVINVSEFSGYPDELYEKCKKSYDEVNAMYAEMFGVSVEDFEVSEEETKEYVEELVYEKMVITAIAEKEKIEVTEDEYNDTIEALAEEYGYDSAEDFEADYTKDYLMEEFLSSKVLDFLLENAKITEVSEEEYYADYYGDDSDDEFYADEDMDDELIMEDDSEDEDIIIEEDMDDGDITVEDLEDDLVPEDEQESESEQ